MAGQVIVIAEQTQYKYCISKDGYYKSKGDLKCVYSMMEKVL